MENLVKLTIDGVSVEVPAGTTVLEAAKKAGINIPTEARRVNLELLLSNHDKKCLDCARNQKCELQQMCIDLGVEDVDKFKGKINEYDIDDLSPSIVRNNNKCILCRRCVAACNNTQAVGVIGPMGRGFKTQIRSACHGCSAAVPG